MAFQFFEIDHQVDVTILRLRKDVVNFADRELSQELKLLLGRLEEEQSTRLLVDFEHVDYFGSTLLEALLTIWHPVEDKQGKMALCNLSTVGKEIIGVSNFNRIWSVYDTEEEAVTALGAGPN